MSDCSIGLTKKHHKKESCIIVIDVLFSASRWKNSSWSYKDHILHRSCSPFWREVQRMIYFFAEYVAAVGKGLLTLAEAMNRDRV